MPEPYWLVDATFEADGRAASTRAASTPARSRGSPRPRRPRRSSPPCAGSAARSPSSRRRTRKRARAAALRPHLAAARGQHALRLLRPAHARRRPALYEEHKALTYPRTSSRYLTERHGPARSSRPPELVGQQPRVRARRRVRHRARPAAARRASSTTPRSATTTRSSRQRAEHQRRQDGRRRPADLRPGRAPLPRRLPSRGGVREHARRDDRRASTSSARAAGSWSCRAGAASTASRPRSRAAATTTRAASSRCRSSSRARTVDTREVAAEEKETKPPRRYSDASLLAAMETAGKLVDDDELREAMKDSGIGTPATRAAIIERLIDVGYVEREGALARRAPRRASTSIRLLGGHPLTSPA